MQKNVKDFIEHVKSECKKYGIKCKLKNVTYLKLSDGINCSGYFDEEEKELVVAMKHPQAMGVLAHEYAHLTQWVDGCKEWKDGCKGLPKVDEWLVGKNIRNIKKYLGYSRDLELDNEKRTVKLIKKWKLPIDIKEYVQRANSYIQFYNWLYYSRKWSSPKNSPYTNPKVYGKMPTKFNMKYDEMGEKWKRLYKENKI